MTKQLKTVYDVIVSSPHHMSAKEVYECAKLRLPSISVATTYRNLSELCDTGIIMKIPSGGGPDRYDKVTSPHPHLRCVSCGRVADAVTKIELPPISEFSENAVILGFDIIINCICPLCAGENNKESNSIKKSIQ